MSSMNSFLCAHGHSWHTWKKWIISAHTHLCIHTNTHTALLEPIKSRLINVLIKLNSTIYLREEKRGETSSHAISLIVPSKSEIQCVIEEARNPKAKKQ